MGAADAVTRAGLAAAASVAAGSSAADSSPRAGSDQVRFGGMALANGVLLHGPTRWAAAVRTGDGRIVVRSGRKAVFARGPLAVLPGLRGIARLAEAVAVVAAVRRALPEARLPFFNAGTLATALAAAVFGARLRRTGSGSFASELAIGLAGLVPALVALRDGRVAAYHGAEHKVIAAWEHGTDAVDEAREHERCGTHLVAPMLALTAAGNAALRRHGVRGPLAEGAVQLAAAGVAFELVAWSDRNRDRPLASALQAPGRLFQRVFGTREPAGDELAVARAALAKLARAEGLAGAT